MEPKDSREGGQTEPTASRLPAYMQDRPVQKPEQQDNILPQQEEQVRQHSGNSNESEDLTPQQKHQIAQHSSDTKTSDPLIATQGGLQKHRAEASRHLSQTGKRFFELIEFDENEKLVLEVRKHPFGLAVIWAAGIFVTLVLLFVPVLVAAFLSSSNDIFGGDNTVTMQNLLLVIGVVLGFGGLVVTFINTVLYKNNVIFVTSEKIAQVIYISLFNRKISQLSIGDLQDVTVRQSGIFPRAFNFGTLTIETTGEQNNYVFTYVPAPYESAKLIVGAHEENLRQFGN